MNTRSKAGLVMFVLACVLLILFFLTYDRNENLRRLAERRPGSPTADVTDSAFDAEAAAAFLSAFSADFRTLRGHAERLRFAAAVTPVPQLQTAAADTARLLLAFTGNRRIVGQILRFRQSTSLGEDQDRQITVAARWAGLRPGTMPSTRLATLDEAAAWPESLAAFRYPLEVADGRSRTAPLSRLDELARTSWDEPTRRAVWSSRTGPGPAGKQALIDLAKTRDIAAMELGFGGYLDLLAADLELAPAQWLRLLDELRTQTIGLYQQLHCYQKHLLAELLGQPVPQLIPAHWSSVHPAQLIGPEAAAAAPARFWRGKTGSWAADQADRLFLSLGFAPLPASFRELSAFDLGASSPVPQAEGWSIDLGQDVRLTAAGRPGPDLSLTVHGAMGTIRMHLECDRPDLPVLLRGGASGALAAAYAHLLVLAASGEQYAARLGQPPGGDLPARLLDSALGGAVAKLPYAAGTLARWVAGLQDGSLARNRFNTTWWEYAAQYQGIAPPGPRGEELCDPATVPALYLDPTGPIDAVLGEVIAHQIHRYICQQILHQGVHEADYTGSTAAGDLLRGMMRQGRSRPWQQVLQEATGEELSAAAMLEYYRPLQRWLEEANTGREVGF